MAIVVGTGGTTSSAAGLSTYAQLVASIEEWMNRADLEARVPDFIKLLETELNRILRVPEMEDSGTLTVSNGLAALASDLLEIRHVYWNADTDSELVPVPLATIRRDYPLSSYTGRPLVYAVRGAQIEVAPLPGSISGTLTILYYEKIPALTSANTSNWVLASHPDIYLYGALSMAEVFLNNDSRLPLWRSAFDSAVSQLQGQGIAKHYGGGPLFPRPIPRPGGVS